ncbi:trypsin-like peptidase domain-containing protein [Rhizobium laguerreae]|uniref:trypsin-like serine peptidase n=1 Tax=Rhizobium laguerreae TaxID=1076926 RepID=UPI001C90E1EA|nr:trypsin-like peptidase domain-containing protein [Rhizobium laguerreae]MBY3258703.1 trypsin-like peptidase domain-containing protein [Rhizobium laguerreae]MBY3286540.1 trypsin-like peptidase domain-containing protein [Rhizobium laguerreae]MBY3293203.1 trypsin-like peptidase domain-containing protein [Rhizobium laguerreae]
MKYAILVSIAAIIDLLFLPNAGKAQDALLPVTEAPNAPPALPSFLQQDMEAKCGTEDDSQNVEAYDGGLGVSADYVQRHSPSTFLLRWKPEPAIRSALGGGDGRDVETGNIANLRWCSATLIKERLALTARHCFGPIGDEPAEQFFTKLRTPKVDGKWVEPPALATLHTANFNYQFSREKQLRGEVSFPILRLVEDGEVRGNLDYALFEIGADENGRLPADHFGEGVVAPVSSRAAVDNELIAIIQHPLGDPKRIDAGRVIEAGAPWMYYNDIDTLSGSSGSGIRDASGVVIGVHTNGGCDQAAFGYKNRGVLLQAIAPISDVIE